MVDRSLLERVINAYNEEDDDEYYYFHPKNQTLTNYPMSNAEQFFENIEDDKDKNKKVEKPDTLKKFLDYHTDGFFKDVFMLVEDDPEEYFESKQKELAEHVSEAVVEHFKKFFAENKNKVEESEFRAEVKAVKRAITSHYYRMCHQIEHQVNQTISEFNKNFKL